MVEFISINNALVVAKTIKTDMILINRKTRFFLLRLQTKIEGQNNVSLRSTHFELTNWNLWVFNASMLCLSHPHPPSRNLINETWICEFAIHIIWNYLRLRQDQDSLRGRASTKTYKSPWRRFTCLVLCNSLRGHAKARKDAQKLYDEFTTMPSSHPSIWGRCSTASSDREYGDVWV